MRYDGPRCFIPPDTDVHESQQGTVPLKLGRFSRTRHLRKGWHYSTRFVNGQEVPDKPLHLNDSDPNEADWFYELAGKDHLSWVEKHGHGNVVALRGA